MVLVLASAVVMGLCFLTRYLAAFLVLPMALYSARIFRGRRGVVWAVLYVIVVLVVASPWLMRNYRVSRSFLGIAKYQLLEQTGELGGDTLPRSYHPALTDAFSVRSSGSKFLAGARGHLLNTLRRTGSDFLIFFFVVGIMYGFRRRDTTRLRGMMLGGLLCGVFGMALIGTGHDPWFTDFSGANLLVLFLPLVAVYGVAFFYLLLDRIPFQIRLTRALAVGAFALLNVSPMIFTMLPPRRGLYPYPPYIAPMTQAVAELFGKDEVGTSDLPWAMAWDGDRRTVWLPLTIQDFYELHDFVAPKGLSFLMLTPQMMDQPLESVILRGEYKSWSSVMRGQLPKDFPLKEAVPLPPNNEQYLFADRVRWQKWLTKEAQAALEQKASEKAAAKPEKPAPAPPAKEATPTPSK
jgi:4-amino-4-deoxy-L-arabinose transferase-like glycosyltransferase